MTDFASDVLSGLSSESKKLSSKYFYDDAGSRIFQEIMAMPEYYLTDCEMEIMNTASQDILKTSALGGRFNVIELGAGDGVKTQVMLGSFLKSGVNPIYRPIDISAEAVDIVSTRLQKELPELEIIPEVGDYYSLLQKVTSDETPSLVLFLGSNIGNYIPPENVSLISLIVDNLSSGDHLLIGVDLKKNPNMIRRAYDDKQGITRRFNLNLLKRVNRELGGDFDLDNWDFYCHYNPMNGEVRSHLVSLKDQEVMIESLGKSFHFDRYELIWTELSKKYTLQEVKSMGEESGLQFKQHFTDNQHHFTDTLFIRP